MLSENVFTVLAYNISTKKTLQYNDYWQGNSEEKKKKRQKEKTKP